MDLEHHPVLRAAHAHLCAAARLYAICEQQLVEGKPTGIKGDTFEQRKMHHDDAEDRLVQAALAFADTVETVAAETRLREMQAERDACWSSEP